MKLIGKVITFGIVLYGTIAMAELIGEGAVLVTNGTVKLVKTLDNKIKQNHDKKEQKVKTEGAVIETHFVD